MCGCIHTAYAVGVCGVVFGVLCDLPAVSAVGPSAWLPGELCVLVQAQAAAAKSGAKPAMLAGWRVHCPTQQRVVSVWMLAAQLALALHSMVIAWRVYERQGVCICVCTDNWGRPSAGWLN